MELVKAYTDINETLHYLRLQVIESIPYAEQVCPEFSHPEELFYWLKNQFVYKKDPVGKELLQTFQTLMENNFHGLSGAGDCDCFVIATLACMKVQGWNDLRIYLAGRIRAYPVHIWSGILFEGNEYHLDLTCPYFDQVREYKYVQKLKI